MHATSQMYVKGQTTQTEAV